MPQTGKKEAKQWDDVEAALLATANSLVEQVKNTPEPKKPSQSVSKAIFVRVYYHD